MILHNMCVMHNVPLDEDDDDDDDGNDGEDDDNSNNDGHPGNDDTGIRHRNGLQARQHLIEQRFAQ